MSDDCRLLHNDLCESILKKIDARFEAQNERINGIEAVTKERQKAIAIQSRELDRRLDILNGHQSDLKADREQFVKIDRYDDRMRILDVWIDEAKRKLNILTNEHGQKISKANWIAIFAIFISTISAILHFFFK